MTSLSTTHERVDMLCQGNKRRQDGRKWVAILQSSYIPWKGYFDLINIVDEFIVFDTAQFTKRDWRSRNVIKTLNGPLWLTIPVKIAGRYPFPINQAEIDGNFWRKKHWGAIEYNYRKTPYFDLYATNFYDLYMDESLSFLSDLNFRFMKEICQLLDIRTIFHQAEEEGEPEGKTERLVQICRQFGADVYLSGPAAQCYLEEEKFHQAGIEVAWMDYTGYPEYPQLYPPFEHAVSILDLLFNTGPEATRFMKSFPVK